MISARCACTHCYYFHRILLLYFIKVLLLRSTRSRMEAWQSLIWEYESVCTCDLLILLLQSLITQFFCVVFTTSLFIKCHHSLCFKMQILKFIFLRSRSYVDALEIFNCLSVILDVLFDTFPFKNNSFALVCIQFTFISITIVYVYLHLWSSRTCQYLLNCCAASVFCSWWF